MKRNYVGLACTMHDPAVAIVNSSGELVFAEAGERSLQYKRALHCVPDDPLRIGRLLDTYCEPDAQIVAAHTWLKRRWKGVLFRAGYLAVEPLISPLLRPTVLGQMSSFELVSKNLEYRLLERRPQGPRLERRYFDHHLTHALAAASSSPFDEAVVAVIDGEGETAAQAFFHYRGGRLERLAEPPRKSFGNNGSLGAYYASLCLACGFDPTRGEEWKVMGLAAYGQRDEALYTRLRRLLSVDDLMLRGNNWKMLRELAAMKRPVGTPARAFADVAHTGQAVFADVADELLINLRRRGLSQNLVLTGGCALNSAYNGQLLERTGFSKLYVPSAPADDGNALGAALLAYQQDHPPARAPQILRSPYLGSSFSREKLEFVQRFGKLRPSATGSEVIERAAELLAQGKILGWARGRAEFGPRALGHRSILADPRRRDIKEVLNARVKFREEFRPFAPSVLHEHGSEYFENYQDSPYMERALRFRPEVCDTVPGVVHEDGTGRLQSVHQELSPDYHALISAFHRRTGVPMVLNTSFNVMGKPIVHSVEDALSVYFTSGLDALALEDALYEKEP